MIKKIEEQLKLSNLRAHSLRGTEFYKGILDYRKKILPLHKSRIRARNAYVCWLCKEKKGDLFLTWEAGYELLQCKKCEAVSANISTDDSHVDKVYNNEIYYDKFLREIDRNYEYRKEAHGRPRYSYIFERLNLNPKKTSLLDVGCGAGYFLDVLREKGIASKGLEVNPAQVRYNKEKGLNVESTRLEDEPDNAYDVITMFDVLEHLPDPVYLISVVAKKLKKGGYFLAYTPHIHSVGFELMGAAQNTLLPFEHFCFYNQKSIDYLAKNSGLEVHSVETYGLDLMDYLLMKEYEDKIDYTEKLYPMMNLVQAALDKMGISNHLRITLRK